VDLIRADPASTAPGYLLTAAGLQKLPRTPARDREPSGQALTSATDYSS